MNRVGAWFLIAAAVLAGIFAAAFTANSIQFRDQVGRWCGRGHLLALVHRHGIYQLDLDRALRESDYLNEIERTEWADVERRSMLNRLIANVAIKSRVARQRISGAELKHEVDQLRWQFRDDESWGATLRGSGLSSFSLSQILKSNLVARQWLANRIAREVDAGENECRRYYESHARDFFVSERFRASHIFLAAPPETAPEIVEAKRKGIEALSVRLASGEDFNALAAEDSEDEATKFNGGDLGYFSTARMPPDFFAAAGRLRPGETSQPVQTRLGFHIIRLVDTQPARQRTFEEARTEIAVDVANLNRATAIKKVIVDLAAEASYLRSL